MSTSHRGCEGEGGKIWVFWAQVQVQVVRVGGCGGAGKGVVVR